VARSARLPGAAPVSATEELCETLGRLATSDLRLTSALTGAAEAVGRVSEADFVEVWVVVDELDLVSTARWPLLDVARGVGRPGVEQPGARGARIAGLTLTRDEPTVVHRDRHPHALAHERERTGSAELSQVVGFPLRARGAPVGALVVGLTPRFELGPTGIAELAAPLAPLGPLIALHHAADAALDPSRASARHGRQATMGLLTAGFVHDVNNAFTVILGCADALATDDDPSSDVADLRAATSHGARLARSFLRTLTPDSEPGPTTDVATALAELEPMIRLVAGSAAQVELRIPSDVGRVPVGRSQLEQAILNLAANAREATSGRGVLAIAVGPTTAPDGSPWIRISVTDRGGGMDDATREQIFTPFFTTKPEGTGLGLVAVRRMVDEGGGVIRVDTARDRGTTFEIDLPRAQGSD